MGAKRPDRLEQPRPPARTPPASGRAGSTHVAKGRAGCALSGRAPAASGNERDAHGGLHQVLRACPTPPTGRSTNEEFESAAQQRPREWKTYQPSRRRAGRLLRRRDDRRIGGDRRRGRQNEERVELAGLDHGSCCWRWPSTPRRWTPTDRPAEHAWRDELPADIYESRQSPCQAPVPG